MLTLGRKQGEGVWVNGPCRVSICEIRGKTVRLNFEAPKSVAILRDEVREAELAAHVSRHVAAGEPFHSIEMDLDARENRETRHG
jgi:carbon storage regulator CsrA